MKGQDRMNRFFFDVSVDAETAEQAVQVMSERLGPDEDYGFAYTVEWNPRSATKPFSDLLDRINADPEAAAALAAERESVEREIAEYRDRGV